MTRSELVILIVSAALLGLLAVAVLAAGHGSRRRR
jgi:hypothetical protein